ncbi:type VI secretion system Vgr family protein [Campylobacter jejuni]|uniref:type VI secretion system Vgr family protein n=1 Tax=Campylobacter jejuni TaxID=197 RepID=UPI000C28C140|nr:contractile injection system protein, VgrG/Pvc8 family [Campylobacter jejuni]PJQ12082.1 type VI secretion protein VgrG [Campylobacter jejuni subsp. jejuni]PJQ18652.1 type VI secretion protein VgrG [Campylobacter jejuni subsp. jejuni]PJQ37216.1 type VI secretion protein VgrG [Campylobacter jejuni subsp. jejuni]PJQ67300.1 type VI secretion protein VgrG [Campylobacter jejuni subsp. jejuni]PJQ77010.1 type VI secretion protein VgrG [Campylobacter jejuni subsp. jejuni]
MSLNSYMSLNISNSTSNPLPFKITKALIKESLEELFSIECEGFFESLEQDLFSLNTLTNASSHPSTPTTFNFHPNVLIDQEAILSIHNPYENNTLNFDNNEVKNYKGIITYIKYLGINHESALNINDSTSNTKQIQYKHFFSFKLQSVLIRLSLNKANRIYTHTNIIEVIKQTLGFYQDILHKEIDYSNIHFNYEEQELISQYNESDLDFITRLSHNNGIFFYEDENTIYFCDVYKNVKNKEIEYNPNINNILNQACISSIYKEQSLRTNSFTHSSINANTPLNLLSLHSSKVPYEQELNNKACYNEHFYESEYSFTKSIDLKTKPSLKEKRALVLNESLLAKSNIYHLSLGDFITLNYKEFNHQEEIKNQDEEKQDKASLLKDFIIIANTQILIDDAILANSINTNDHLNLKDLNLSKSYSNTLTLLKKNIIFTPSFKAKPKAPNSTQGIVIGESKDIESERNAIYTDEHGRVKVRINLYANQEELDNDTFIANDIDTNSSNLSSNTYKSYHHTPFLRVASHIASNHSGFFHTPRIGDEVIISFLDDDIDKPYVSGSLYNGATTMPQYNYPRYKREIATNALSYLSVVPAMIDKGLDTLKLQENTDYELSSINNHYLTLANSTVGVDNTDARARNEITLKNDKDKEEIYILAQKDYKEEIGNNYEQTIKNNKTSEVGALYTEFITLGHMQNIIGFKNVNVGAEYLENTLLSKDTNVGLSNTLNVGISNEVNIGQNHEEKIGNDKRVIINNNLEQDIKNDFIQRIGHNKNETIKGSYVLQTNQSIKFYSKQDLSIETNEYFKAEADDSISFKAKKNCSFTADNVNTMANQESVLTAQKQIVSRVGNTTITQTKDKIILQVGTTQVIIDSKGLRVKGGDLRAD